MTGLSVWERAALLADPKELRWRRDPVAWTEQRMGAPTWSAQRTVMRSVVGNRKTAVQSGHGVGKTWTAADLAMWWIDTHPPGEAYVVSTAPSYDQVHVLLWEEIRKGHRRAKLLGRVTLDDEWRLPDGTQVGEGRKPPDHRQELFQGLHRRYVLVLIDEACGIPAWLWDAVETITTGPDDRILAIGNPDIPNSRFAKVCAAGSGWNVIKISVLDSPNFTGEQVPYDLAVRLTSREWVDDKRAMWGEGSALFIAKVLAEFPTGESPWVTVSYAAAAACRTVQIPNGEPVEAGVDVAAGGDRTVIRERRGWRAGREFVFRDPDPMRSIGTLVERIADWGITRVKVDVIGVGWALYGRLRELSGLHNPYGEATHQAEVVPVNFANKATSPEQEKRFVNLRAEVWWEIGREYSRLQRWDLTEVDDDTLAELTAPNYEIKDSRGKILIEAKDDVKKRLGLSPDRADALLLAFWSPLHTAEVPPAGADQLFATDLTRGLMPGAYGRV